MPVGGLSSASLPLPPARLVEGEGNQLNWDWFRQQWPGVQRWYWLNVVDFGATRGEADDTQFIQDAVDYAVEHQFDNPVGIFGIGMGFVIFFPPGTYVVNGPIEVPPGISIRFLGSGFGWSSNTLEAPSGTITVLRRNSSYNNELMFDCGDLSGDRCNVTFEDMLVDGKGSTGITEAAALMFIKNSNHLLINNVRIADHIDDDGLGWPACNLYSAYNATLDNVYFTDVGSPGAFSGASGEGAGLYIGGDSNTINCTNLEFEGCRARDLWIGNDGGTPVSLVNFSNTKFERGQVSDPAGYEHIRIGVGSQGIHFNNTVMPVFREVPHIVQDTTAEIPTIFTQLLMSASGNDAPDYWIDVQDGSMNITASHFQSTGADDPNIAYIHLDSAVDNFHFDGTVSNINLLVDDER